MDSDPVYEEEDRPDASLLPREHTPDAGYLELLTMVRLGMIRAYWLASVVCIGTKTYSIHVRTKLC